MTFEDKAEIVINQLRADRDRLQNIVNNHIVELEKIRQEIQDLIDFEESCCGNTTLGYECLGIINKTIEALKQSPYIVESEEQITIADAEWVELAIKLPKEDFERCKKRFQMRINIMGNAIANGTLIPEVHGRLGDLDELERRISNFVERDAHITDEYTVIRQRFIVDGIRDTPTIIEANKGE